MSEELNNTVPVCGLIVEPLVSEPPRENVPVGNTSVPESTVRSPEAVAFVSVTVKVPAPSTNKLNNEEPFNVMDSAPPEYMLTVPADAVIVPPVLRSEPPIASSVAGITTVPAVISKSFEVVALSSSIVQLPEPEKERS